MSEGDITVIGPECFASVDDKVISWKGANFYKACDELVMENPLGGATHCVKRVDHPGDIHEDYDGNRRGEDTGKYVIVVTVPLQGTLLELHSEVQEVMAALKAELGDKEGRQVFNAVKDRADQIVMILEGSG